MPKKSASAELSAVICALDGAHWLSGTPSQRVSELIAEREAAIEGRHPVQQARELAYSSITTKRDEWLEWPTGYGYWWMKATPDAEPKLVSVQPAKDGHALAIWDCPGIGRLFVDYVGAARYQQVQPASA